MRINFFRNEERLKKGGDIQSVLKQGVSFRCRNITIFLLSRNKESPVTNRIAFVISKRLTFGKSYLRNRFKRILREAYRKTKHFFPKRCDIVILATNIKTATKSKEIEKEISDGIKNSIEKQYQFLS